MSNLVVACLEVIMIGQHFQKPEQWRVISRNFIAPWRPCLFCSHSVCVDYNLRFEPAQIAWLRERHCVCARPDRCDIVLMRATYVGVLVTG